MSFAKVLLIRFLIRFSAPVEMTQQFYSQELMQYSRLNPRVQFSMLPEMTVRDLLNGDTDIAVVNHSPADQSEIVTRHVVSNSTPIFASRNTWKRMEFLELPKICPSMLDSYRLCPIVRRRCSCIGTVFQATLFIGVKFI